MADDFIQKAVESNDFNNGGISVNDTGGGSHSSGPDSPLSARNQSNVEAKLEAVANTAKSNEGAVNTLSALTKEAVNKQPCPPAHEPTSDGCCGSQSRVTIDISTAIAPVLGIDTQQYKELKKNIETTKTENANIWPLSGGAAWVVQHLVLNGLSGSECGCWIPVVGLTDLYGGMVLHATFKKLTKVWGRFGKYRLKMIGRYGDHLAGTNHNMKLTQKGGDYFGTNVKGTSESLKDAFPLIGEMQNILNNNSNMGVLKQYKDVNNGAQYVVRRIQKEIKRKGFLKTQGGEIVKIGSPAHNHLVNHLNNLVGSSNNARQKFVDQATEEAIKIVDGDITGSFAEGILNEALRDTIGFTFAQLLALTAYRPKICFGEGSTLNEYTCECECDDDYVSCGFFAKDSIGPEGEFPVSWTYDLISANFLPTADELSTCAPACDCHLALSGVPVCKCQDCEGGYTWKAGAGCGCEREYGGVFYWQFERGICLDDDFISESEGLGKTWNGIDCTYECAIGTHVRDGKYPDGCSRLVDNFTGFGGAVPTNQHHLYQTGCNYVCDARAISDNCSTFPNGDASSFPPTCDAGYIWDGSALGCLCRKIPPTCPSSDPACKRDDILTGQVAQDGESGAPDTKFFFRGCYGCTGNVPGPTPGATEFSDPGSVDAMRALIASWAGDVVEREGQENYRICVTKSGGPIYFWDWYAYDCEAEGCGPCS